MLRVVTVSSYAERENADALAALIRRAWPGIDGSQDDFVTIAAGLKLIRESDLLVTFDLERARGGVQAGAIVIEVKRLDASRLEAVGNDLRPRYNDQPGRETVLGQLKGQIDGLVTLLRNYDRSHCFIHGLAWMRGATSAELRVQAPDLSPQILGADATWDDMLKAAALEHHNISAPANEAYRDCVRWVTERLTRERRLSARDLTKLDRFTTEVLVRDVLDEVMQHVGHEQVRLQGGAGSGKSTTLALLARRVVQRDDARVLFLTYHRVLRGELEHLVRTIAGPAGLPPQSIVVRTMFELLVDLFEELGGTLPRRDGAIDYNALPAVVETFLATRDRDELQRDAQTLRELHPSRFDFDYVFIDEAQDWRSSERDLLRLLFAPAATVLADGLDQFAQRQSRCDWASGTPKPRYVRRLNRSLRMSSNVAAFVTAFARAMGYADWSITPHPELTGGRVILARSPAFGREELARALSIAQDAGVSPGDCLIAVPPALVETCDGQKRATIAALLRECGVLSWDACGEVTRLSVRTPEELAVVPYGSVRGLEGWLAMLLSLDAQYANRKKHPNIDAADGVTPEDVARRTMLLAVTRAAHVLFVTTDEAGSPVTRWLDEAADAVGPDVVERWNWHPASGTGHESVLST